MSPENKIEELMQENLFRALTNMTRSFVLEADRINKGKLLSRVDECLESGWILNTNFSLAGSGPLTVTLSMVSNQGVSFEILNIDASTGYPKVRFAGAQN